MTLKTHFQKLVKEVNVAKVRSSEDIKDITTIYFNRKELMKYGKDKVIQLDKIIDTSSLSVSGLRKLSTKLKKEAESLCKEGDKRSFEEIYAEIKDPSIKHKPNLAEVSSLFSVSVSMLEDVFIRLISNEYIHTFEENDVLSKNDLQDDCKRLENIIKVVKSLI